MAECNRDCFNCLYDDCIKDLQSENHRYYMEHREQKLAYQRAYNDSHREQIREYKRAYDDSHREQIQAYKKAYREAHREEIIAYQRRWRESKKHERAQMEKEKDQQTKEGVKNGKVYRAESYCKR